MYAQVKVSNTGCRDDVAIEQYWRYGSSSSNSSDSGPTVQAAISSVLLDRTTRTLVVEFCYMPLEVIKEALPPPENLAVVKY